MTRIENPRVGGSISPPAPFKSSENSNLSDFCVAAKIVETPQIPYHSVSTVGKLSVSTVRFERRAVHLAQFQHRAVATLLAVLMVLQVSCFDSRVLIVLEKTFGFSLSCRRGAIAHSTVVKATQYFTRQQPVFRCCSLLLRSKT